MARAATTNFNGNTFRAFTCHCETETEVKLISWSEEWVQPEDYLSMHSRAYFKQHNNPSSIEKQRKKYSNLQRWRLSSSKIEPFALCARLIITYSFGYFWHLYELLTNDCYDCKTSSAYVHQPAVLQSVCHTQESSVFRKQQKKWPHTTPTKSAVELLLCCLAGKLTAVSRQQQPVSQE